MPNPNMIDENNSVNSFQIKDHLFGLTFPSTILCLTHSFSLLVSNDTESMHRLRQKFLAPNQSSSTPCNAGSRHEKKYL